MGIVRARDDSCNNAPWSSPRWSGWIGSTCGGCWDRLETCRRRSLKRSTMSRPRWPDSMNPVSEDPGTVQSRKLDRNPCRTAAMPSSLINFDSVMLESGFPRGLRNTRSVPSLSLCTSCRIASKRPESGTR